MHALLSMASCVLQRSDGGSLKLSNVGGDSDLDLEGEEPVDLQGEEPVDLEGEEPVDLSGISVPSVSLHRVSWGEYLAMGNFAYISHSWLINT